MGCPLPAHHLTPSSLVDKEGFPKPQESSVQPLPSAVGEISGDCYFTPFGTSSAEPCPTQGREDPRD